MTISFTDPFADTPEISFGKSLGRHCRAVLQNVWQYAERYPEEVYALIDFENKAIDTFTIINGKVVETFQVSEIRKFDDSEERRTKFLEFLARDVHAVEHVFAHYKVATPRRMWLGVKVKTNDESASLDYTPMETELSTVEEAREAFRLDVTSGLWPSPFLEPGV